MPFLDILAVRLHRRQHIGKAGKGGRIVFLDEQIDRMAAGGDDHIAVFVAHHPFVFCLDNRRTDRCFLYICEAEFAKSLAHGTDSYTFVICNEGRRKTDVDRCARLKKHLDLFGFVYDLLGVLWTYDKALTAHDAVRADDVCLVAGEADGFYRTVPDTVITVFAVGFFECQTIHVLFPFSKKWSAGLLCGERVLDLFHEEIVYGFRGHGEKLSVHGDANAFLTLFQTERTGKRDFVRQSMFRDEPLKLFHNLS